MADSQLPDDIEIWKPVDGWPEYEISSLGRARRVGPYLLHKRRKPAPFLKPSTASPYPTVLFCRGKEVKCFPLHILVARTFLGPPPITGMEVNHKDTNTRNARLSNLEWMTRRQNRKYAFTHGKADLRGSKHPKSILKEDDVRVIRKASPLDYAALAGQFGVALSTVRQIANGHGWTHV